MLDEFSKAIKDNNVAQVVSLIKMGAVDANARLPSAYHPPALIAAVLLHHAEIVAALLENNARIE